jgi:hypothetical protein
MKVMRQTRIRMAKASGARLVKKFTPSAGSKFFTKAPIRYGSGKAYSFDVGHSLKDQKSNRRSHLPGYAAWEIHPVMRLETL